MKSVALAYHLLTFAIQIYHSASRSENEVSQSMSRNENKVSHSVSRNENIDVCPAWSRHRDFRVSVASHVPDHHSLLPTVCETCTVDNWPVHGRYRERFRVALQVHRGFHDLGFVSADVAVALFACLFEVCVRFSSSSSGSLACCAAPSACSGRGPFQRPVTGSGTGTRRKHSA